MKWTCPQCIKQLQHAKSHEGRPSGSIALRTIQPVDAVSVGMENDGVLSLQVGELLRLEYQRDDGWWYGTSSSSHRGGWFPSSCVDFLPGFKLGVSRCSRCFVLNPRFSKNLPSLISSSNRHHQHSNSTTTTASSSRKKY